jgi:Lon protease-like protein
MDDGGVTRIPLFPLRSVLCPGVALPLHIFEERYRLMIRRCLERGEPFGVVLIREGREVGPLSGAIATVGTTASIREAGRYPDGRYDILTIGQQRFHVEAVDSSSEPYLVARVRFLEEPLGPEPEVRQQAEVVGRHFLEYLQLLQPVDEADGPEIQIEFEVEVDEPEDDFEPADEPDPGVPARGTAADEAARERPRPELPPPLARAGGSLPPDADDAILAAGEPADLTPEQRRELLMAAAHRLLGTGDPTALSYVLTALIQVELPTRQGLLEAPTTMDRLLELDRLLRRESWFLRQGLRPILIDASGLARRAG